MKSAEAILPLTALQQIEAAALQLLQAVRSAGKSFCAENSVPTGAPTVASLFNDFLLSKTRAGRSNNYLRVTHAQLSAFSKGREGRAVATISAAEIEAWAYARGWSPHTIKNHIVTLRTVFTWAVTRGELAGNVAVGIDLPQLSNAPPGIHTTDETRIVLETARAVDLNTARFLAVRYFAGLRASEAAVLDEKEIGKNYIEVTAAKAKTRRRRLVTIQPVLRAWLDLGGQLPLRQVNNRLRAVTSAAAVPWPKNAPRHSFCSYHLAQFQNAGKTAMEAGHTEQMLFAHYRELVTPDAANEFWGLFPK